MKRARGGQKKHWAEQARVQCWYGEVKRRCDWSDYLLDKKFAWTEPDGDDRESATRPRTFEWIRKKSRVPRGLDPRWRSMADLVVAVEKNVQLAGTQEFYDAIFWDLLQDTTPSPETVQHQIDKLLATNGLVRVPAERVSAKDSHSLASYDEPELFDRCLRLSLHRMNQLSQIALAWLLYIQTEPPHNARFRVAVEAIVDQLLDHFFEDHFPDLHLDYYPEAIGTLCQTRLDLSARNLSGYGYIETIGTWPVIPEELVGKLTENHLIPEIHFFFP